MALERAYAVREAEAGCAYAYPSAPAYSAPDADEAYPEAGPSTPSVFASASAPPLLDYECDYDEEYDEYDYDEEGGASAPPLFGDGMRMRMSAPPRQYPPCHRPREKTRARMGTRDTAIAQRRRGRRTIRGGGPLLLQLAPARAGKGRDTIDSGRSFACLYPRRVFTHPRPPPA
ncbi:hypothetical protein K438DRAFT_2001114 [Mycena galopus ATCC 62051]|nr:hypothetical protein K438DRAFT_2001114 [Mycena galopus ATCC 62051]